MACPAPVYLYGVLSEAVVTMVLTFDFITFERILFSAAVSFTTGQNCQSLNIHEEDIVCINLLLADRSNSIQHENKVILYLEIICYLFI